MGDGTRENPLTREDVLRLIEENGGTANGLDLSGKTFEAGIDLRCFNLDLIILEEARFAVSFVRGVTTADTGARLQQAKLNRANLKGASLRFADLQGAELSSANLQGANLSDACLVGVGLYRAQFDNTTNFQGVNWGDYKVGEELHDKFDMAVDAYRRLKVWYTNAGVYDIAGEFFYREMEAKRKSMKWWPQPWHRAWVEFVSFICGYGERPYRVILWAASVVLGLALIYFAIGSTWEWWAFWNSLYFSAVSFTALGYGRWAPQPTGWVKGLGAFEAFVGVFMMALFLVTFIRKMTR